MEERSSPEYHPSRRSKEFKRGAKKLLKEVGFVAGIAAAGYGAFEATTTKGKKEENPSQPTVSTEAPTVTIPDLPQELVVPGQEPEKAEIVEQPAKREEDREPTPEEQKKFEQSIRESVMERRLEGRSNRCEELQRIIEKVKDTSMGSYYEHVTVTKEEDTSNGMEKLWLEIDGNKTLAIIPDYRDYPSERYMVRLEVAGQKIIIDQNNTRYVISNILRAMASAKTGNFSYDEVMKQTIDEVRKTYGRNNPELLNE